MNVAQWPSDAKPWFGPLLALLSALATWGLMQARHPFFVVSSEYDIGMGASSDARLALDNQTQIAGRRNAMLVFGLGGCLLGASLALITEGCCAMPKRILAGLAWGALWGAFTGFAASYAHAAFIPRGELPSVTTTGMSQAVAFGLLGAGLGGMVGGFQKSLKSIEINAVAATIAGGGSGFLFAILVGFVAEAGNEPLLIPAGAIAQLLWLAIPLGAIGYSLSRPPKASPSEHAVEPVNL